MVIHKFDLKQPVEHRSKYYIYINKGYNKNYTNMNEYKSEKEFQSILNKITLADVLTAIKRGKDIRNKHINDKDHLEIYNGFKYYRDNPDITLHLIIESILIDCKIISKR